VKAEQQDLYGWLNYQNKLMKQDPQAEFVVLYNAAGMNVSAALFRRDPKQSPFYAEHTVYAGLMQTQAEGEHLVSILNSANVNEAIKPFQSLGLLGERHIEKKVLELPIPLFDRKDPVHNRLAALGKSATEVVAQSMEEGKIAGKLAALRRLAREASSVQLKEIDELVGRLLRVPPRK
jgi:hypothetical protein